MATKKKLLSFTAVDFETANHAASSICQIGIVRIENGELATTADILIRPPGNFYHYIHRKIHGIGPEMTAHAPAFDEVWPDLQPLFEDCDVVAHNINFDYSCLVKTLTYYGLGIPEMRRHCTYRLYGMSLDSACRSYNIPLNHHNALSDAWACAALFMKKQSVLFSVNPPAYGQT
jgi:DNA polymerase III subunit epsilon